MDMKAEAPDSRTAPTNEAAPAFTPGPWSAVAGISEILIMQEREIGPVVAVAVGRNNVKANAHLIAAAPDLYLVAAALDEFQRRYQAEARDTMPGNELYSAQLIAIVAQARAALAKAEGR